MVLRGPDHLPRAHPAPPHLYGTGDADDPPDIAADREVECFYIRFDRPDTGEWLDGGTALSLREAMFLAQQRLGPVVSWSD